MIRDWLPQATQLIFGRTTHRPRVGVILGSGLGGVVAAVQQAVSIPYREIPGLPVSTAIGHKGQLTLGSWAGQPVAVMEGRFHRYEGYSAEQVARPIDMLRQLGVETLIATNAAGGLHPNYRTGEIVVVRDHVNLMNNTASSAPDPRRLSIYDPPLTEMALHAARQTGGRGASGVYIGMTGPNYETRAEYRWLRGLGDLVGMSTVPEALRARQLGMRVAALSVVSNECRPDALEPTDGAHVVAAVALAAGQMQLLLEQLIGEISFGRKNSPVE